MSGYPAWDNNRGALMLLVAFGVGQGDPHAVFIKRDVFELDRRQFGASERTTITKEENGAITSIHQRGHRDPINNLADHLPCQTFDLTWWRFPW